jgi:hypothetical protein
MSDKADALLERPMTQLPNDMNPAACGVFYWQSVLMRRIRRLASPIKMNVFPDG